MAFVLKTQKSISQSGETLYITDITGTYNITTNPTGYGTPNPVRNTFALIIFSNYKGSLADTPMTITSYVPETANGFTIELGADGWYTANTYLVPLFDSLATYAEDDITYNALTNELQIFKSSLWEDASEEDLLADNTINNSLKDHLKVSDIYKQLHTTWVDSVERGKCKSTPNIDKYNYMRMQVEGAIYDFCNGARYESQKTIEELINYIDNC